MLSPLSQCHGRPFLDVGGARSLSALVYLIVVVVQFENVLWMFFDCELPTDLFFSVDSFQSTYRQAVSENCEFRVFLVACPPNIGLHQMMITKNLAWTRNGDRSFDGVSGFLKSVHMSLRGQIFC